MEPIAEGSAVDMSPSQNVGNYDSIVGDIVKNRTPAIEQTETGLSSAQQAVTGIIQQRKSNLNSTFASVSGTNPDEAAAAQSIGGQIGVGQDLAMQNMASVKKAADQKRFESYDLMAKNPVLGRQMMDREFASVAHDDIPQLTSLGGLFKVLGAAASGQPFPLEVAAEIAQQFGGSQYQTEEALIYHWMSNNGLEEKDLSEETRQRLKTLEENAPPPINTYLFGGLSYAAGQARSMAPEVAKYAIAGGATYGALGLAGGPLAPATVAGGVLIGTGLGATAGIGVVTSQIEGGMLYKELLRNKVPKDVARTVSSIGGTVNGLIEIGTLGLATAPFKAALKKVVGETIIKRGIQELAKPTAISAIKTAGKYYGMEVLGEQVQEISQEMTSIVAEDVAGRYAPGEFESKFSTPEGLQELANRLIDVSEQTFKATAVMGAFGPMLNLAVDAKNIRDSAKTKQFLTDLSKNVQATKLKGRSPSALANFVAAQAQGTAAETMYVDAEEMTNVLNQSGLTVQQIDNALPGVREQLSKATSGGDIQIPTAQFAANIVGTKLEAPLMEHARLAPDAISAKQAIAQQETMQQNMKDAQAEMAVQEVTNAQFVREAKEIEKVVNDQLVAAGRPPTEAAFAAKLVQARAVTGAAAAGITPAQWVAQHPVPTFQSQRQAAQAAQQAPAKPFVPKKYEETTVTPEQTASLSEPLVAAESELAEAKTANSITERGGKQIGDSLQKLKTALARGKLGEIGAQTWKLLERLKENLGMKAASELASKTLAALTKLGVEFYDPIGIVYTEGWVEVEIINWLPYKEGVSKDKPFVEKVISPIVRRNGQIIQRGQVQVREGRIDHEEHLAKQAKDAEIEAKMQSELDALQAKLKEEGKTDEVIKQLVAERKAELEAKAHEERYGKEEQQAPAQVGQQDPNILRQSAVENLQMVAERGQRVLAKNSNISKEEQVAIEASSKETRVPVSEIESAVRKTKLAHPEDQGWAPLVYSRTIIVDDKVEHEFQTIPYDFSTSQEGNALEVGSEAYTNRVASIAKSMTEEVRSVLRRAKSGDKNALNILAQAGWYKAFRSRLRQEFGGLGDLFADLLGATSPNTPVRGNYWNAIDSLRRATRGDFDALMPQWEAWADKIDPLETDLKSFFNAQLALGKTKADIRRMPEFIQKLAEVKAARKVGDELLPTKETGMKYGFNGKNVIRAMVNLWRIVKDPDTDIDRGGTAPKAVTFSGNLIGFKSRATIDVWAARNLQRLNGGKRIPSAAESGVSGELKESGVTTLQFGFGQDVFTEAVGLIRNDPELKMNDVLASINDDDLQAVVWFIEKEFWTVNDWTSVAGEGGSFELEANLSGTSKQERVTELRKIVDASPVSKDVSLVETDTTKAVKAIEDFDNLHKDEIKELQELETEIIPKYKGSEKRKAELKKLTRPEKGSKVDLAQRLLGNIGRASDRLQKTEANRIAAKAELASLERSVDRFVGGLSIQMSMDTQGTSFVPADSDMARLSHSIKTAIYESDSSNVVLASKALSTEGRYGGVERALDLEVVAREGYNANLLWKEMLQQAKEARQDSAFLSRVLRTDEDYDPIAHRPGIEIYFREATSKVELDKVLAELAKENVEFLTVVVDGRRQTAFVAGAMPSAVGVRMQYIPEFEQRYGMDNMTDMDNAAIAAKVEAKAAELRTIAAKVTAAIKGVSFAGQFWYDTQVAFSHQYQEKIDAITTTESEGIVEDAGAAVWQGQSIGSGIEDANRQIRETSLQQSSRDILSGNATRADQLGQAATGGTRGEIDPVRNLITIKNANSLTVFHELMHWFVIDLFRTATDPAASELSKSDADILLKWFGIGGSNMQERIANWNAMTLEEQRRHHETAAYNAEIWVATGRAPSVELQGVFERFRRWATRAYKSIRDDLNEIYKQQFGTDLPFMTDEVRGVFDRMLASEEQIARREAIDNFKGMYQTQEESGMNDATWAAYQAEIAEAHEMAVTDLTKATVKQMEWLSGARKGILKAMQAAHNALRRSVQGEESNKMDNEPVRKAERFFKTGKMVDPDGKEIEVLVGNKIDSVAVGGMYPTSTTGLAPAVDLTKLRGMTMEGGLAPDLAAEMFGFSSGDELIRALAELKPFKDELKERTDARMLDEHGGMNTEAEKEEAVNKALANEVRARIVAIENRYLTKVKTPVAVIMQGAKELARTILGRMAIKDIKPRNYVAAEARVAKDKHTAVKAMQSPETAGKSAYTRSFNEQIAAGVEESAAASEALVKSVEAIKRAQAKIDAHKKQYGNVDPAIVAAKASHQQVIQGQLAKEGYKILEEVEKQVSLFKRFFKDDKKIAATRNMDLVNAARSILAFYGLGKHDKLPGAYLKEIQEYNPGLFETISAIVNEAQVGTPDYRLLTFEEFQSMQETVDALWQLAKRENQIKIEGKMVSLGQATEKLEKRLDVIGVPTTIAGETQAVTSKDRAVRHINSMKAMLRRIEHWADATDGAGNFGGPFTKYIWRPISQALDAYRIDRNNYVKRYVELLKQVSLPAGKIAAPELNYTFGAGNGGIGIAELLGAIMHSGNISNLEKLLIGRKWATVSEDGTMDTSRWDAFVARVSNDGTLTKEHFDFIQAVWDLNEELKPMVQKAHYDIEGYYFKEVEATPFTNRFGTYRGGYVPAKTDPFIVRDAQRQAKMSELESDFRAAMPSTGAGFTKSRVKYNKALSLDIRLMAKHIDDVIRYSHVQPAVKDVLRILKKSSFADKLTQMDAMAIDDMLTPWLNRAARQITNESGRVKAFDTFWRTVRSRTGISVMIGNITNALQQVTGLFMSAIKVSPAHLGNALYAYVASPNKSAQEVCELSPFMKNKMENQIFDLQDQMNELLLNPNKFEKIQKWSSHHGYFLQSAFQNMVDVVTWTGAYNQYLEESGVGMSDHEAQREAVNRADAAVRLTQGTMNPEGIAAFEVGTPFYKTFIQFTGYFNMLANLNTDEYVKIFRDLGWRGNKGKLVSTFMLGFAAQAIISDAIVRTMRGGWEDDDNDGYLDVFMDWIFGSMARSAVAMVPFGSTAMTSLSQIVMPVIKGKAGTGYDDRIQSSPSISALTSSTVGVGRAILDVVSEGKEVTGQDVKDVMTLISLSTGVPVTILGRPVSYLVDVNRGKVEPTSTVDLMRGLITGTATKESKKR